MVAGSIAGVQFYACAASLPPLREGPADGRLAPAYALPAPVPASHVPTMEAFLVSLVVVAIGEIGDKTQLLALVLAARFRQPVPIICGILVATLVNHALAGLLGAWVRAAVPPDTLRLLLVASFFAVALWALKPDKLETEPAPTGKYGAFAVTVVAFFIAETGDKTQIATVVLAAQFDNLVAVVAGTTLGMLIADVPAVIVGSAAAHRLPLRLVRYVAAGLFAVLGIVAWFAPALP
jgi:Ca2+/H+ antiporter, TMEM165/GDT1 family